MPTVGDVLQVAAVFQGVEGGVITNVFKMVLTRVAVNAWESVADDVEAYLVATYDDWMENVSTDVVSEEMRIDVRDAIAGEWNNVVSRPLLGIDGMQIGDSLPSLNAATTIAYPGQPRHWGFKNWPAPAEFQVEGGNLTLAALADLLISSAVYVSPYVGVDTDFNNGVYTLSAESFKGFAGSIKISSVIGSRVTRKEGRGI